MGIMRDERNEQWSVRVGVNPIGWTNDDFHDLGDDTPLERCLAEIHAAGFAGVELGRKFPRQADALRRVLAAEGLVLVSGWHSLHLLEAPIEAERHRLDAHLDLLLALGTDVAIVAECSRRTYDDPAAALQHRQNGGVLAPQEWRRLGQGLDELADHAARRGVRLAYHPHMGTVVQTADEIDALLDASQHTGLLLDTGHAAFAGSYPIALLAGHGERIIHVHLKNVRPHVVQRARDERWSFATAVRAGVFTVPGDGGLDFAPILARLRDLSYRGWLVVEAEQDPRIAPAFEYAQRARTHVRALTGV